MMTMNRTLTKSLLDFRIIWEYSHSRKICFQTFQFHLTHFLLSIKNDRVLPTHTPLGFSTRRSFDWSNCSRHARVLVELLRRLNRLFLVHSKQTLEISVPKTSRTVISREMTRQRQLFSQDLNIYDNRNILLARCTHTHRLKQKMNKKASKSLQWMAVKRPRWHLRFIFRRSVHVYLSMMELHLVNGRLSREREHHGRFIRPFLIWPIWKHVCLCHIDGSLCEHEWTAHRRKWSRRSRRESNHPWGRTSQW